MYPDALFVFHLPSMTSDLYLDLLQDVSIYLLLTMNVLNIDYLSLAMADGRTHLSCLHMLQAELPHDPLWLPLIWSTFVVTEWLL